MCLRSIFGSVRTQFIWNNLCQRNLIRPMSTWTFFRSIPIVVSVCVRVCDFCSFPFWQTKYKIDEIMPDLMATDDDDGVGDGNCWRVTDYHSNDNGVMMMLMNEWMEKSIWKNQEIIPFLSGRHLISSSFFFSLEILSSVDIINILCVFFCWICFYLYFWTEQKNGESSILFSIIYFYSMILSWWVCIQYLYKYLFVHFYGVYTDTHRT